MLQNLREPDLTLQVIFTPRTFRYLRAFTSSLVGNCSARLRIVANGCDDGEMRAMREYAEDRPARVEMRRLSSDAMVPHGVALDELYESYDDGSHFCFVDSDVKARGPFLAEFVAALQSSAAVTSGRVAWSDDAVLPPGSRDLAGRYFVDGDGFVYGSSYVALYSRDALRVVRDKYGISFRAAAHANLSPKVTTELAGIGRAFDLYDTAKVTNILLQANGYSVNHFDHDALLHVGGISQYLSHPRPAGGSGATIERPWFATSPSGARRWDFAQWAAETLTRLVDGGEMPALPDTDTERAAGMQRELRDLVAADTAA